MTVKLKRRSFLRVTSVAAGAAAASYGVYRAVGANAASATPSLALDLPAHSANTTDEDQIRHVLNRITFGPRPGQIAAVKKIGLQTYMQQQLNPASINDSAVEQRLKQYDANDVVRTTIERSVNSERQLYEVVVLFWSEHFSIGGQKPGVLGLKAADDRDVMRKYAFGKFSDLLLASATSPAMLLFLDNALSDKAHPNENYARELMELHTLGVGNYTEKDVKEVARCLTGWSIQSEQIKPHYNEFLFKPDMHDDGAKVVLGHTIPAGGGMKDGQTLLSILASHPATAKNISLKLCRRFIGDKPSDAIVKSVTDIFTKTGGDILSMLTTILKSTDFLNAPPKFKRPYEYSISLYRAFDIKLEKFYLDVMLSMLDGMRQLPFSNGSARGFSDLSVDWLGSSIMEHWNAALFAAFQTDLIKLAQGQGIKNTSQELVNYYAQHLLGHALTTQENDILTKYITSSGVGPDGPSEAIAMIAASASFQYR